MRKPFNHYFTSRNIGLALLISTIALTLAYILFSIYQLFSNNHIIQSNDIYKIGSFKMQDKAYYHGGGKYSSPSYTFQSRDGYRFTIESSVYKSITHKRELIDTLQYHELTFTVYSDKQTFEVYQKSSKPIHINVLQFQVGNKTYIDLNKLNKAEEFKVISSIITGLLLLSVLVYYYNRLFQRKE